MDETRDGREKEGGQGFLSGKDQPHKPNRNIASLTPEMFFFKMLGSKGEDRDGIFVSCLEEVPRTVGRAVADCARETVPFCRMGARCSRSRDGRILAADDPCVGTR